MKITSTAFKHNEKIPTKHTCDGVDINPELLIEGMPKNTQSLVLIMDDPDAIKPAGKVWDHWIIFNMPRTLTQIKEGEQPEGIAGRGTSGKLVYKGPCPPDTQHRYFFKLYALDAMLDLNEGATKKEIEEKMQGHIIEKAELIGLYERR